MKKLAIIAALAVTTVGVMAQGTITWGNTGASTPIRFGDGPNAGSKVFPGANYLVGLYIGPAGASAADALSLVTTRTFATQGTAATSSFAGVFPNQTYAVQGMASGTAVTYMIKAWSLGFASYEAARMNGTSTTFAGTSGIGSGTLGGGALSPLAGSLSTTGVAPGAVGTGAVAAFNISIVPEPASASLLGLGLASLLIFRRRK